MEKRYNVKLPTLQAHAIKRGTVSLLKRLGLTVEEINLHVGWSACSKSFEIY